MTPHIGEGSGSSRGRMARRGVALRLAALAAAVTGGCAASAPGASLAQLQTRAVYDLGCPAGQIAVYHLDARTKAAVGCGRRLLYVESCQRIRGKDACTWVLDTPSFAQAQWPQLYAPPAAATYVVIPPTPGATRVMATSLFDGTAQGAPTAAASTPPPASAAAPPPPAPTPPTPAAPTPPPPAPGHASPSDLFPDPFGATPSPSAPPGDEGGRIISTELGADGASALPLE